MEVIDRQERTNLHLVYRLYTHYVHIMFYISINVLYSLNHHLHTFVGLEWVSNLQGACFFVLSCSVSNVCRLLQHGQSGPTLLDVAPPIIMSAVCSASGGVAPLNINSVFKLQVAS